ncbi:hypothetical protein SCHPADRAFT_152508 [Schizopora paradoxa]|uniref:Uncharacterized protein n=1 Tax=Schizopora paradoxa TaxID=27342 RepID=A0A0H2S0V5_9AGAM|nr:hypothetical protein SCHPADRAFT_152508 [Schizopora paradoxa]
MKITKTGAFVTIIASFFPAYSEYSRPLCITDAGDPPMGSSVGSLCRVTKYLRFHFLTSNPRTDLEGLALTESASSTMGYDDSVLISACPMSDIINFTATISASRVFSYGRWGELLYDERHPSNGIKYVFGF